MSSRVAVVLDALRAYPPGLTLHELGDLFDDGGPVQVAPIIGWLHARGKVQPKGDSWRIPRCAADCGYALDPVIVQHGWTLHPGCEPTFPRRSQRPASKPRTQTRTPTPAKPPAAPTAPPQAPPARTNKRTTVHQTETLL